MTDYKGIFMDYLLDHGVRYTDVDENVVSIGYNAQHVGSVKIYVFFDKDGEGLVHLASGGLENFSGDSEAKGVYLCNTLNRRFRWTKFELDGDQEIIAENDAIVYPETVGEVCLQLVRRMVGIIDEAFPDIEKAKWA